MKASCRYFTSESDLDSSEDIWCKTNPDSDWEDILFGGSESSKDSDKSDSEKDDDQDPLMTDTEDANGDLRPQSIPGAIQFNNAAYSSEDEGDQQKAVEFLLSNPSSPFKTASDFKFAHWMIEGGIGKTHIHEYFNKQFDTHTTGNRSAYTMHKLLDRRDPDLGQAHWHQGSWEITEGMQKQTVCYYFRPVLACIQYLL